MVTKNTTPQVEEDPWEDTPNPVTVVQGTGDREYASITFKAGTGYNAPWLVLKPSSMEEAKEMVEHEDLSELLDSIARKNKEFERYFGGAPATAAKAATGGGWGGKAKASAASSEQPSGTCPVHNCDLVYVEPFVKRDGSKISARVACPVPKCYAKTFWQDNDGSWTEK